MRPASIFLIIQLSNSRSGISFLVLAGLFIFQKKNTLKEFRKKFRM